MPTTNGMKWYANTTSLRKSILGRLINITHVFPHVEISMAYLIISVYAMHLFDGKQKQKIHINASDLLQNWMLFKYLLFYDKYDISDIRGINDHPEKCVIFNTAWKVRWKISPHSWGGGGGIRIITLGMITIIKITTLVPATKNENFTYHQNYQIITGKRSTMNKLLVVKPFYGRIRFCPWFMPRSHLHATSVHS